MLTGQRERDEGGLWDSCKHPTYYIDHLSDYFDHDTKYVAIRSSLRRKKEHLNDAAEKLYSVFTNRKNEDSFKEYLSRLSLAQKFLKHDKLSEYGAAIDELCKINGNIFLESGIGNVDYINACLKCYFNSLLKSVGEINSNDKLKVHSLNELCTLETLKIMADLMCKEEPQELEAMHVLYDAVGDVYRYKLDLFQGKQ